jgi:2-polyprenyl-3-methyl-5-hydroxy-6-metoxy-1,4-benzoquinol methylase
MPETDIQPEIEPAADGPASGVGKTSLRGSIHHLLEPIAHAIGRVSGKFYVEDYIRVYPDGFTYLPFGFRIKSSDQDLRNFKNHAKFYSFASQFVLGFRVLDAGCGSGYGSGMLKRAGASSVAGRDLSEHAIRFARAHFGELAEFQREGITDLRSCPDNSFDVVVSSEVLEHIKEYGKAGDAVAELNRVARPGGLIVVATPNAELLKDHGFTYDEIRALISARFRASLIIENALVPFDEEQRRCWEERLQAGRVGLIVSERIDLTETVLPRGPLPILKHGVDPTTMEWENRRIDLARLHNTHSWVVLAVKDRAGGPESTRHS